MEGRVVSMLWDISLICQCKIQCTLEPKQKLSERSGGKLLYIELTFVDFLLGKI